MPRVKLASERVNTNRSSSGSGVTPTMLGGSLSSASGSVSAIRAPTIDMRAANVQFTPVDLPKINVDTSIEAGAKLAGVMVKSAIDYQDRENSVRAQDAVLRVSDIMQRQYYGGVDSEGNKVAGYASTKGIGASDSYDPYVAGMNEAIMGVLKEYDPAVQQKAMLRIADVHNTYKSRAARHRAEQLLVEEQDKVVRTIDSALRESENDPNWLFQVNPVSGMRRIDDITGRHAKTFQEKQELQSSLISGVFSSIRYRPGKDAVESFKEAKDWYDANKDALLEIPQRDVESQLQVMEGAAATAAKKINDKALEARKQDIVNGGPEFVYHMLQNGKYSYAHVATFIDSLNAVYENDYSKADDAMLVFIKEAAKNMAVDPNSSYEAAVAEVTNLAKFAEDSGVELLTKMGNRNDLREFLAPEGALSKYVEDVKNSKNTAGEKRVVSALNVLYDTEVLPRISGDKANGVPEKYYENDQDIFEDFRQLRAISGESEKVAEEKRKIRANIISASKLQYGTDSVALISSASTKLRELHAKGAMFETESDLNAFLLDHKVLTKTDRDQVLKVRNELATEEGKILNTYAEGVVDQIKFTFEPDTASAISQAVAAGAPPAVIRDIATSKRNIHPVGQNIINKIRAIEDKNIPVPERVEEIRELLVSYTDKVQGLADEGVNVRNFEHALQIEAAAAQIDRYINYGEYMTNGGGHVNNIVPERSSSTITSDMLMESYIQDYRLGGGN